MKWLLWKCKQTASPVYFTFLLLTRTTNDRKLPTHYPLLSTHRSLSLLRLLVQKLASPPFFGRVFAAEMAAFTAFKAAGLLLGG